jgi:hypothetical protein
MVLLHRPFVLVAQSESAVHCIATLTGGSQAPGARSRSHVSALLR